MLPDEYCGANSQTVFCAGSSTVLGAIPAYHESFQWVIDHITILFILFVWRECRRKVLQCVAL